jgi:hypothetical protein
MVRRFGLTLFLVFGMHYLNAQRVEEFLATNICKQLDSVDVVSAKTVQQKKEMLLAAVTKTIVANAEALGKFPELQNIASYEQGKKIGKIYSEKVAPLLIANCPRFRQLSGRQ